MSFATEKTERATDFVKQNLFISNDNGRQDFYLEEDKLILPLKYSSFLPREKREPTNPLPLHFNGLLRSEQYDVLTEAWPILDREKTCFFDLPTNFGKCLEESTKVLLFNGQKKMVKDLHVNDQLIGDNGFPRTILSVIKFRDSMFKLKYNGKTRFITRDHILTLVNSKDEVVDVRADQIPKNHFLFIPKLENGKRDWFKKDEFFGLSSVEEKRAFILGLSWTGKFRLTGFLGNHVHSKEESKMMRFLCRCMGHHVRRTKVEDGYSHSQLWTGSDRWKFPFSLEEAEEMNCVGFTLDGNGRFLLGDNVATHNTTIGIYLTCIYRVPTCVLTYNQKVRYQWKDKFESFSDANVKLLKEKGSDVADVVIVGVEESLNYDFERIKLLIIDEGHQSPVTLYTKCIFKFRNCEILIGMSATPRCISYPGIFEKIFSIPFVKRFKTKEFTVYKYLTRIQPTNLEKRWIKGKIRISWTSVIASLSLNINRAKIVAKICERPNEGRTLVLCDRLKQIDLICSFLEPGSFDTFSGNKKEYGNQPIIVAEERKGGVGMDDTSFTKLIRAFDNKYPEQNEGRIRVENNEIWDLVDAYGPCEEHWKVREKWYKKRGATIVVISSL